MLESEVNHEENQSKDHSSDHNQKGRALKLSQVGHVTFLVSST